MSPEDAHCTGLSKQNNRNQKGKWFTLWQTITHSDGLQELTRDASSDRRDCGQWCGSWASRKHATTRSLLLPSCSQNVSSTRHTHNRYSGNVPGTHPCEMHTNNRRLLGGWHLKMHSTQLQPTDRDPLLVSRFALSQPMGVGGKCRPIRLLSGAVPLYAPPLSCHWWQLTSAHAYAETPPMIRHLPPTPAPSPEKLSQMLLPSLGCHRYGGQMSAMVTLGGHVSVEGANTQRVLCINAIMILLV